MAIYGGPYKGTFNPTDMGGCYQWFTTEDSRSLCAGSTGKLAAWVDRSQDFGETLIDEFDPTSGTSGWTSVTSATLTYNVSFSGRTCMEWHPSAVGQCSIKDSDFFATYGSDVYRVKIGYYILSANTYIDGIGTGGSTGYKHKNLTTTDQWVDTEFYMYSEFYDENAQDQWWIGLTDGNDYTPNSLDTDDTVYISHYEVYRVAGNHMWNSNITNSPAMPSVGSRVSYINTFLIGDHLTSAMQSQTNGTMVLVYQESPTTGLRRGPMGIGSNTPTDSGTRHHLNTYLDDDELGYYDDGNSSVVTGVNFANGQSKLVLIYDRHNFMVNGDTTVNSSDVGWWGSIATLDSYRIGQWVYNGGFTDMDGYLDSMIVYDRVLTTRERSGITAYLKDLHGIA